MEIKKTRTSKPIINIIPPQRKLKMKTNPVVKIHRKNSKIFPNSPKKINAPTSNTNRRINSILVVDKFGETRLQFIAKVCQDFID